MHLVTKLFAHIYKTAEYLDGDRASVICTREGIEQNLAEKITPLH